MKLSDAFDFFVNTVSSNLSKNPDDEFLLVGNNMPMLSTIEWSSPINKIMIGKVISSRGILLRKTIIDEDLTSGKDYQYYMIVKEISSGEIIQEPIGNKGPEALKKFEVLTKGTEATHTGIIYHANGKIYQIRSSESQDPLLKGENEALTVLADYFIKNKQMFSGPINNEIDSKI